MAHGPGPLRRQRRRGFLDADRPPPTLEARNGKEPGPARHQRRDPFAGGGAFGDTGAYERLLGKAHYAIDPDEDGLPYDLSTSIWRRAMPTAWSSSPRRVDIIKPVDLDRGNNRLLYEFSNRGNRGLLSGFNYGTGADMTNPEYAGDGFLMRLGYTADVVRLAGRPDRPGHERRGAPARARCRTASRCAAACARSSAPWSRARSRMGASAGAEGGENVQPYPVLDRATATLTMREHEADAARAHPGRPTGTWRKAEMKDGRLVLTPSNDDLYIKGGFKTGWIYEFIYDTEGSRVMGLGFLGVRDLLSMLRFDEHDSAGNPNPLAGHVEKLYGTGASLSGRVDPRVRLRGLERGRRGPALFDGIHTHTGSGRLFQNQRFAQVGRYPRQHEEHQWPAECYPFTFVAVPDPFTGAQRGPLAAPRDRPPGHPHRIPRATTGRATSR